MNVAPIPVVPGADPVHKVLQTILQRCGAQHETQQACQRLHARLLALQVAVVDSRQTEAMSTFEAIVVQFLNHVERFRDQTLLLRVVTHRKKMTELETLNQRVDLLLDRLELFKLAARDWQQQLQDDNQLAEDFFKVTVKDRDVVFGALQDPQTQVEALMTLKFAIERQDSQGGGLVVVMKDLVLTIESLFQTRVDTLPLWFVPVTEVRCESRAFGRGPHGTVHRGVVGSSTKVVKRFGVGELVIDERARLKVEKEVNSWHEMSHPNVVQLLAASHVSSPPFVLYEEALNGNLGSFLARSEENRRQMWKLLYQAALGLAYIHQRGVVHGNLKLNNILVGADGQAKVSDVGLATMRSCCSVFGSNSCGTLSSSVRWWAPECLQQRPSVASDVYSFGMCIIEAVSGEPPFAHLRDNLVVENLTNPRPFQKLSGMTDAVWELLGSMVDVDSVKRPTLDIVIDHLKDLAVKGSIETAGSPPDVVDLTESSAAAPLALTAPASTPTPIPTPTPTPDPTPIKLLPLTDASGVPALIRAVAVGSEGERELALELLLKACVDDATRQEIYDGGIPSLVGVVENGRSHFEQVCALECLRWTKFEDVDDVKLPQEKYKLLRDSIREATASECADITNSLRRSRNKYKKWKAVTYCACITELGFLDKLGAAGAIKSLHTILEKGDEWLKLWASQALGNFATYLYRYEVERKGALAPLIGLLESGTDTQKRLAACAVGFYSKDIIVENVTSIRAIAKLLGVLLQHSDNSGKAFSLFALGFISDSSYGAKQRLVEKVAIAPIVEFLRTGTNLQKEHAAHLVGSLADSEANRKTLVDAGAITAFAALLSGSTDGQKMHAAYGLGRLANSKEYCPAIVDEGAIPLAVELLRSGSDKTKRYAMHVLLFVSDIDKYKTVIGESGAIEVLTELLRHGSDDIREDALQNLRFLIKDHEPNSIKLVDAGGSAGLAEYMRTGPSDTRFLAAITIGKLAKIGRNCERMGSSSEIEVLVESLKDADDWRKTHAVKALGRLASHHEAHVKRCLGEEAMSSLLELRRNGNDKQKKVVSILLDFIDSKKGVKRQRSDS